MLKGDVSMLSLLLSSNSNYNPSEPLPFFLRERIFVNAAHFGNEDAFNFALENGPLRIHTGPDRFNYPDYVVLCLAIQTTPSVENYHRGVVVVLPDGGASKNFGSSEQLLSSKAGLGHVDMVQYILSQGTSPNRRGRGSGKDGDQYRINQPLSQAIEWGPTDVVELLLQHGANPNGFSDLDILSIAKEDTAMFRLLRGYGARLDTPETGAWAMAVAQFWGFESMVDLLVQEGVERGAVLSRCPERREISCLSWCLFWRQRRLRED
ncbi:hypothetical protein F5B21DRAFT_506534 [Xylaria acuta]|nr:hypothetical protein F5B21DRAFT_506534 [Xylaria acuta]